MPIAPFDWQSPDAPDETAELARAEAARAGRVTNMKGVLLHSPAAFRLFGAVLPLKDELRRHVGARAVDIFSLAISEDSQCLLCSLYFRRALKAHGVDPDAYVPTEDEAALIEVAHRITGASEGRPFEMPEALARLQTKYGAGIAVAITAYGAAMLATNRLNITLGIPIDDDLATPAASAASAA